MSGNCGANTTDQSAHAVSMSIFLEPLQGSCEPHVQKGQVLHSLRLGKGKAEVVEG